MLLRASPSLRATDQPKGYAAGNTQLRIGHKFHFGIVPLLVIGRVDLAIIPAVLAVFIHTLDDWLPDAGWVCAAMHTRNNAAHLRTARRDGDADPLALIVFLGRP